MISHHTPEETFSPGSGSSDDKTLKGKIRFAGDKTLMGEVRLVGDKTLKGEVQSVLSCFRKAVRAGKKCLGMDSCAKHLILGTMYLFAARIVEKSIGGNGERIDTPDGLFASVGRVFPNFFRGKADLLPPGVYREILKNLDEIPDYGGISSETAAICYEKALLERSSRKKRCSFYTPFPLAREILQRLPIEEIPEDDRYIIDLSCGHGNFLRAAAERLGDLLPADLDNREKHSYLTNHILGNDNDPLAVEICRLLLFLKSYPLWDGWRVDEKDFLDGDYVPLSPSIIVTNPPFLELDKRQIAALFLDKYLDILRPGGLMGIILPRPFLDDRSCRDVRRRALLETRLLEIKVYPERTIPYSNFPIAVILLRKKVSEQGRGTSRILSEASDIENKTLMGKIREGGKEDVDKWLESSDFIIRYSPLDDIWEKLEKFDKSGKYLDIFSGIKPGRKRLLRQKGKIHPNYRKNNIKGAKPLLDSTNLVEPYLIRYDDQEYRYALYPGDFQEPRLRYRSIYEGKKVIIYANKNPVMKRQISAGIDNRGCFPTNGFWCITPKGDISLEEICVFLNSSIVNAWFSCFKTMIYFRKTDLLELPFPRFSREKREEINRIAREVGRMKEDAYRRGNKTDNAAIETLIVTLDNMIFESFGLSEDEKGRIIKFLDAGSLMKNQGGR